MKKAIILAFCTCIVACSGNDESSNSDSANPKAERIRSFKWTNGGLNKENDSVKESGYFLFADNYAIQHTTCTEKISGESKSVTVVAQTELKWESDSLLVFGEKVIERKSIDDIECVSSVGGYTAKYEIEKPFQKLKLYSLTSMSPPIVLNRVN